MANITYNCTKCRFTTVDRKAAAEHARTCIGEIIEVKNKARAEKTSKG